MVREVGGNGALAIRIMCVYYVGKGPMPYESCVLTNCGAYSIISSSSATTTGAAATRPQATGRVQRGVAVSRTAKSRRRQQAGGPGVI